MNKKRYFQCLGQNNAYVNQNSRFSFTLLFVARTRRGPKQKATSNRSLKGWKLKYKNYHIKKVLCKSRKIIKPKKTFFIMTRWTITCLMLNIRSPQGNPGLINLAQYHLQTWRNFEDWAKFLPDDSNKANKIKRRV